MRKLEFLSILVASIAAAAATSYWVATSDLKDGEPQFFAQLTSQQPQYSPPQFTQAAENGVDAVVNITNSQIVRSRGSQNPFYALFGIQQPSREVQSGGSGVILSEDGYIVTNNHVVENAQQLTVTLSGGKTYPATLVGSDPSTDLALVKISEHSLPTIKFGDSDKLRLGEWVLAIGNPYGLNSTVTAGIISAKERKLDVIPSDYRVESFLQTDAAVNPGNSGGALVNTRGELIGINTVIKSPTGSFAGYSFAVPSSIVERVVSDLKEYGTVHRALLGIGYSEIDESFAQRAGIVLPQSFALYVGLVDANGAASKAGIRKGDIILSINQKEVASASMFQEIMAAQHPGDVVVLTIERDGSRYNVDVKLG